MNIPKELKYSKDHEWTKAEGKLATVGITDFAQSQLGDVVFVELPAGKIDQGEAPLLTGQRELLEETGYTAQEWVYLGLQHPCIGYSNEVIHIYLARGLTAGEHKRDEDEALHIIDASLQDCLAMVQRGEITDGKTIVALMWAEKYLSGQWQPMPAQA